jgi:hypothetical protein
VNIDAGSVPPQAFQAVELALFVDEDVYDEVDEIHQDPVGDAPTFDVFRLATALVEEPRFDRLGDRQGLTGRRAVANHEIVGEVAETAEVEHEYVFGLLVESGVDDLLQYDFQRGTSSTYNPCR